MPTLKRWLLTFARLRSNRTKTLQKGLRNATAAAFMLPIRSFSEDLQWLGGFGVTFQTACR